MKKSKRLYLTKYGVYMSKLTDFYIHKASLQEEGKPIDPQWEMLEDQLLKEELLPELIEQLKTVLSKAPIWARCRKNMQIRD